MRRVFRHRTIKDGYILSYIASTKKTYWLTVPGHPYPVSIIESLKTLPGYDRLIVDKVYSGYEIWFNCTLPLKDLIGRLCEFFGLEAPEKKYGAGGGRPKKVLKVDSSGAVVKEYDSGAEAAADNHISPSSITKSIKTGRFFNGYRYCR